MKPTLRDAAIGAFLGSLAVVSAFAFLVWIGLVPEAPWVTMWLHLFGGTGWVTPAILGGLAFLAIGTAWGLPFAFVSEPSTFKGIVYGVAPTVWAWSGVPLILDAAPMGGLKPLGLAIPIVMNCLIWGSILGWWCHRQIFGGNSGSVYY